MLPFILSISLLCALMKRLNRAVTAVRTPPISEFILCCWTMMRASTPGIASRFWSRYTVIPSKDERARVLGKFGTRQAYEHIRMRGIQVESYHSPCRYKFENSLAVGGPTFAAFVTIS